MPTITLQPGQIITINQGTGAGNITVTGNIIVTGTLTPYTLIVGNTTQNLTTTKKPGKRGAFTPTTHNIGNQQGSIIHNGTAFMSLVVSY